VTFLFVETLELISIIRNTANVKYSTLYSRMGFSMSQAKCLMTELLKNSVSDTSGIFEQYTMKNPAVKTGAITSVLRRRTNLAGSVKEQMIQSKGKIPAKVW
jgi:hypothetical protein